METASCKMVKDAEAIMREVVKDVEATMRDADKRRGEELADRC